METLLSINKLGYATIDHGLLWINSESGQSGLALQGMEPLWLIDNIISRLETPVKLIAGGSYRIEFNPYNVYFFWDSPNGEQEVFFDEVEIVKMINVRKVRDLILSRKPGSN